MGTINFNDLYGHENIFCKTKRLVLRKPIRSDMQNFMYAFACTNPSLAKWYLKTNKAIELYWEGINSNKSHYCTICSKNEGTFIGYCSASETSSGSLEIGINLLKECQNQGIGTEAINALLNKLDEIIGPVEFEAKIEANNLHSQHLFRKLQFKPAGIDTFLIRDPEQLRAFEESRIDEIDDNITALADEFGVESRELLSHLLVFKRGRMM